MIQIFENRIKNKLLIVFLIIFCFKIQLCAQKIGCQTSKLYSLPPGLYYSAENLRSDTIDVLKYTINLNITDFITDTIRGNTIVKFVPKINPQNKLRLDLLKMKIDSVKLASNKLNYSYNDTLLHINLGANYTNNDTLSVEVYYHGKPQGDPSGWGGFYFSGNYAYNLGVGFGANPHNYGRVWFPCFDNFVEKSKYEFNITSDSIKSAYCNGRFLGENFSAGLRTRHWLMEEEIPSYLASVAVADYTQVNWSMSVFTGTLPIVLTARAQDTTAFKNGFVNLKSAITGFENYFGPYLWNRVGYCLVPFNSGAMEHATNIAYPLAVAGSLAYEASLMAHELAHHWWGDLMTCETQEDMWLNEGMATYSSYLFKEWVYNKQQYINDVKYEHDALLHFAHLKEHQYRAVSGVPHAYTYGDHVYKKGADVAHTLRTYMGDSAFFKGLKYVLNQKAYKSMNSLEFKTLLETSSGQNLGDFFTNWVLAGGWPHFSIDSVKYNVNTLNNVDATISVKQKITGAPSLYNNVPLEVSFFDSNWQRVIKSFTISGANQTFTTHLNFLPVFSAINYDSKISDAISSEVKVIKNTGGVNYTLAKSTLTVVNVGADSSLIRFEHNYCKPDPMKYSLKNYKLSNQRYWKVDGMLSNGFVAKARFNWDGTSVPATPASAGANLYLDTCLMNPKSDSLVLLYRRNAADDWREVTKYSKTILPGSGKIGFFQIDTLKLGEYTFANKMGINSGIGIKEERTTLIKLIVYPNPTDSQISIKLENYSLKGNETLEIYNVTGKLILKRSISASEIVVDFSNYSKGNYFISILRDKKVIARDKIVLQ